MFHDADSAGIPTLTLTFLSVFFTGTKDLKLNLRDMVMSDQASELAMPIHTFLNTSLNYLHDLL